MILAPLRSRDFRRLWLAYVVSTIGDVLFEVGVMVTVFERTGSAVQTVAVTVCLFLPRFLMGPIAGTWVDRHSRRWIMIGADLVSAALIACLLVVGTDRIVVLYAIVIGLGCVFPFRRPARLALLPNLVDTEQLVAANSLMQATAQAAFAFGYAAGGILAVYLGLMPLIALDLGSFLLAAGTVFLIRPDVEPPRRQRAADSSIVRDIRAGLKYLRNHRLARTLVQIEIAEHLPHGIWTSALMLVFTGQALGGDADDWGFQNGAFYAAAIGGAALAVGASSLIARYPGWTIIADGFLGGVFTIGYALSPNLGVALVFCVLMGPAVALRDVAQDSLLQASVDDEYMGRVQAMRSMGAQLVFMSGGVLFAWAADMLNVRWIYLAGGGFYILCGLYALSRPEIRRSRIG